jgi:hypothetical protein
LQLNSTFYDENHKEMWQEPSIPIKGLYITILGLRHKWWRFETMEDQVDWMDGKDIIAAFAAAASICGVWHE